MVKTCKAETLTYITTCGGFLPEHSSVESHFRELGTLFSIEDVRFYAAEALDIYPDKVQSILEASLTKMKI